MIPNVREQAPEAATVNVEIVKNLKQPRNERVRITCNGRTAGKHLGTQFMPGELRSNTLQPRPRISLEFGQDK
jgi:hypothetical protein